MKKLSVNKIILLFFVFILTVGIKAQENDSINSDILDLIEDWNGYENIFSASYLFIPKNTPEAIAKKYELRKLPLSFLQEIKKDGAFWYADSILYADMKKEVSGKTTGSDGSTKKVIHSSNKSVASSILLAIIILGVLSFVLWYLFKNKILFGAKHSFSSADNTEEQKDIFSISYTNEINKAINAGNYRMAIRLQFLRLLTQLSDLELIQYRRDKTNFDYLEQLRNTTYYPNMFHIVRMYEYTWYGSFEVSEKTYLSVKNQIENMNL